MELCFWVLFSILCLFGNKRFLLQRPFGNKLLNHQTVLIPVLFYANQILTPRFSFFLQQVFCHFDCAEYFNKRSFYLNGSFKAAV